MTRDCTCPVCNRKNTLRIVARLKCDQLTGNALLDAVRGLVAVRTTRRPKDGPIVRLKPQPKDLPDHPCACKIPS